MDGAIYLTDLTGDFGWTMLLLEALRKEPMHVTPDMFQRFVRHSRTCGDTPLLVATTHGKVDIAKKLLEWGALVSDPAQHRKGKSLTELATPQFTELFETHVKV